jgi:PAS domain S-box-containing protein
MTDERSGPELAAELQDLRARLAEAEEVLHAIRNGEVDAVLVTGERGEQIYTLRGADRVYRQLIETMSEGAVTLSADGVILYGNVRLAEMLRRPLDQVVGTALRNYLPGADQQALDAILAQARTETSRREFNLKTSEGRLVPVYLSASRLQSEGAEMVFCLVLTDLTEQKSHEQIVAAERLARLILEQAEEAIVVCDEQGRVIRASEAAQRFCDGHPLLRPFAEVFPLRRDASDPFHLAPVLQGETVRNVDVALDRQGQKLDLILNAGPLRSGQQILGCVVTLTNITERKKLEREVALRQQRLDSFFQGATAGLMLFDEELRFVQVNATLAEMGGVPAHEMLGRTVREVVPNLAPVVEPLLRRVLTRGEPVLDVEVSGETRSQPGVERHWLASYFPFAGSTGKPQGVGAIVVEVTERKQLEAQLRQAQKMDAIGRLAGGVAHDFNNILQAMLSSIALLQLDLRGAGAAAEPLKELDQLVRRAASLTQQLLLFSRRQPAVRVLLELKDAVRGVNSLLRRVVRENVAITSELADSPLLVLADRGQLEQVLLNLAVNASDAMPDGGTITLRAGADGGHVFFSVSDTGHGITDEVRAHLFEPFFTTKALGKGTGLGLAVVHGIVTAHGGRTEVTSTPGEGATFVVWLPRAEAQLGELADLTKRPDDLPVGGNEHILLVEDEEGVRKSVAGILRSLGYTVTTAASGEEAGARPAEPAPDLLLTDVGLPGMTGAALAEGLRDRWPALKVVMMSGYLENEALRDLAASRRVHFLQKPFDMRALALTVRQTLDDEAPRVG